MDAPTMVVTSPTTTMVAPTTTTVAPTTTTVAPTTTTTNNMDSGNRGSIQSSSGGTALSSSPTVHFDPPKTDPVQPQPQQLARNPKKRSRASRRAPTTLLTTDTTNFRAMVQEFTGIPAPPFTSSSSPFLRNRLDLFATPAAASTRSYPLSDGLYPGLSYKKDMVGAFLISAAEGIVERLLSQAKDLISNKINNQINLASSFTEDLEDLSRALETIHALLHDADQNRKTTSATMLVWLNNLKAVICDAEDLLDELAYEALRRKIEEDSTFYS
ncbi:hypothetical protein Vadar_014982 [Vaccinium darrowii]|uniref:Uncharacterized protein n=1 Tax=Vaccinium darrowii TaxID=229202 RepID=A0ACB7X0Y0_9ERIC|nr:hypothetical protein Vadar_014982 [Vaccinium darrowii]